MMFHNNWGIMDTDFPDELPATGAMIYYCFNDTPNGPFGPVFQTTYHAINFAGLCYEKKKQGCQVIWMYVPRTPPAPKEYEIYCPFYCTKSTRDCEFEDDGYCQSGPENCPFRKAHPELYVHK